jgi:hypothetical protein
MIELKPGDYGRALPLLQNFKQSVIPFGVVEGYNTGRVFVDDKEDPQIVLVWTTVGFIFLVGPPPAPQAAGPLSTLLAETLIPAYAGSEKKGLVLVTDRAGWEDLYPVLLPGGSTKNILRRTFTFDLEKFKALPPWRDRIPDGYRMEWINEPLAELIGLPSSWASPSDFAVNGLGYALMHHDDWVAACASLYASSRGLEVDTFTKIIYRRKGFAALTIQAFIEECLNQGRMPNWECFWEDEPSMTLAAELGFTPYEAYPAIYWEES